MCTYRRLQCLLRLQPPPLLLGQRDLLLVEGGLQSLHLLPHLPKLLLQAAHLGLQHMLPVLSTGACLLSLRKSSKRLLQLLLQCGAPGCHLGCGLRQLCCQALAGGTCTRQLLLQRSARSRLLSMALHC